MPTSDSDVSEDSIVKSQIRSSVKVIEQDKNVVNDERSDGELDDSDDEKHDKYKENNKKSKSDKRGDDDDLSDNENRYSRRSRRHSSDNDDERYNNYRSKEDNRKSKSSKRGYYSDQSDNERRYSKRSRRYSSDHDDNDYDNRNRSKQRSKYSDEDEDYENNKKQKKYSEKDRYRTDRKDRKSYVDLDKPRSDDDGEDFESHKSRRKSRRDYKERKYNDKKYNDRREREEQVPSSSKEVNNPVDAVKEDDPPVAKKTKIEDIFSKAGGAYIPPSKLRQMQEGIEDKSSMVYQRMAWEALKKSIVGLINKVNTSNVEFIVKELCEENIVRGRGLVAQSIIRGQVASPSFTNVFACVVSIINSRFPNIGELILRRLIIQFRKSFKRNDKLVCINSVKFIAHLVNQQVAHELLALEILTLLLQNHTGDSVEVAVSFLKDVGQKLLEVSPKGMNAVFERLRNILHDSLTDKRVQYMIEVIFHIRRDNFQSFPSIDESLDNCQVVEDEQITHLLRLDDSGNAEDILNVFKLDPNFVENEEKYKQIRNDILGESSDDSSGDDDDDDDEDGEDSSGNEEVKEEEKRTIVDMTETNLVELRRLIYLTIQSSLDFHECAHKMLKFDLKEGQQHEFCSMVVECCAQQRSYEKFYGLLAQRFCLLRKEFMEKFMIVFQEQYETCHHLETSRLRNTAKLFSHLLVSDGIPWTVLQIIKLTESDTTSSSRIFIKILFQELAEYLGMEKLKQRLRDPTISLCLEGVFPRDDPNNTRFAINFFTAIGLGVLTDDLREHLKSMPKISTISEKIKAAALLSSSSSSSGSSSSDSSDSDSDSSSSSSTASESKKRKEDKNVSQKKKKRSSSLEERKSHKRISETDKRSRQSRNSKELSTSPRHKKSSKRAS